MDKKKMYKSLWLRVGYAVVRDGHIRQMGTRAFAVFIIIRTYSSQDNIAFPSLRRIAFLSGCSIRTVQKEIEKLVKMGWIEKYKARDFNGKYKRNNYHIMENDLIRGTDQPSFTDHPVADIADGIESNQWKKSNYG